MPALKIRAPVTPSGGLLRWDAARIDCTSAAISFGPPLILFLLK
jgi:hypothetical protein